MHKLWNNMDIVAVTKFKHPETEHYLKRNNSATKPTNSYPHNTTIT